MSIPLLNQVAVEVRRVAIAGSVVAGGDFRLKKLIAPLEQAGQKAAVFTKVAQAVARLSDSDAATSAEALLELSTLVHAILYTQGETGIAGAWEPIRSTDLGQQATQASARVLKPLLAALQTTGSGRLEVIKEARQRGAFRDLRLVQPALAALDDSYPEIGEFVATEVLSEYGPAIVPALRAAFDCRGKAGQVRRLALLHRFDPEGSRDLVRQALDEGSKEVKVAAIACLGGTAEEIPFLLTQAKAKAKDVRAAALAALSNSTAPKALAAVQAAIQGNDLELTVQPLRSTANPQLVQALLDEAGTLFSALVAGGKNDSDKGKQAGRMLLLLDCLRGRGDQGSADFLLACFERRDELAAVKGEPSGKDVQERLIATMANGPRSVQQELAVAHATLSAEQLPEAFWAACRTCPPAEVYDLFSPYLLAKGDAKDKKRKPAAAKRAALVGTFIQLERWSGYAYFSTSPPDAATPANRISLLAGLDERWLDLAVAERQLDLVRALVRPGHSAAQRYLAESYQEVIQAAADVTACAQALEPLIRVEHPAADDYLIAALSTFAKDTHTWGFAQLCMLIPLLPNRALPKLESLLPTLPERKVDSVLDYVTQLKNRLAAIPPGK